jgi:hypothetical protein
MYRAIFEDPGRLDDPEELGPPSALRPLPGRHCQSYRHVRPTGESVEALAAKIRRVQEG